MLRFYGRLLARVFPLLWASLRQGDAIAGVLTSVFTFAGLTWVFQLIPSWVPIGAFALLFSYGLLKANYDEFHKIEHRAEELEGRLATAAKRKAAKDLLGDAVDLGRRMQRGIYEEEGETIRVSPDDMEKWVDRTRDLIEAMFDKGEAEHFLSGQGFTQQGVDPATTLIMSGYKYSPAVRFWRLDQLIIRANSLPLNPDFDPEEWRDYVRTG